MPCTRHRPPPTATDGEASNPGPQEGETPEMMEDNDHEVDEEEDLLDPLGHVVAQTANTNAKSTFKDWLVRRCKIQGGRGSKPLEAGSKPLEKDILSLVNGWTTP